ncbi:MAG TPA: hypothetical protein PLO84_01360 [Thermotogota bacterium]|mgnify:CR=1 FL=1|nr:hypothetical protein [Thermotogota bacterium]
MKKKMFRVCFLFLFVLMLFISCQVPLPSSITPQLKNIFPHDLENNVPLNEPITFEIESFGQPILSVYLYLSESSSFLESIPHKINSYEYIPQEGWDSDKTYYWKVKIVDDNGETLTKAYHFTTTITAQYEIVLLSPEDDSTSVSTGSDLQWEFTEIARMLSPEYLVYVSEDERDLPDVTPVATNGKTYLPLTGWSNDTDYYWMIRAVSATDQMICYATSVINHFKTETIQPGYPEIDLLSPLNDQRQVSCTTALTWRGTPYTPSDQLQYKLYIAKSLGELDHVQPVFTSEEAYLPATGWKKGQEYFWKVQACEGDKCSTAGPRSFITADKSSGDPEIQLLYPDDGQQNVKLRNPLTYVATPSQSNPSTLNFKIFLAQSLQELDDATPVVTNNESYLPLSGWDADETYFWKVEAVQGDYTDNDGPWTFETESVDPGKPQITLSLPEYGSDNISPQASVTWDATPVYSGDRLLYEVYYALSFEALQTADPVLTDKKAFLPQGGWGKGNRIFWKVKVIEDHLTNESAIWDFKTVGKDPSDPAIILLAPEDGQENVSVSDFLSWLGTPGTIGDTLSYRLYIAYSRTELEYVDPIITDAEQYRPVNGWEYDKQYYWKCEVLEGDRTSISGVRQFTTEAKPFDIPSIELLSPENRAINVERDIPLHWSGTPAIPGDSLSYRVYYANSPDELDHAVPFETADESFLPAGGWVYGKMYYWKCVVVEGNRTNVSEIRWFITKDQDPLVPEIVLRSPLNEASDVSRTEPLKWEGIPADPGDALTYKLYYAKTLQSLYSATPVELAGEEYLQSGGWEYSQSYYWRCEVIEGNRSNVSDIFRFTTEAKSPDDPSITLTAPADQSNDVGIDMPLQWEGTQGTPGNTLAYQLYIAHTEEELKQATPVHTAQEQYLLPGGWESDRDYYWRCEVFEGGKSDISDIWRFHTESDEPVKPEIALSSPVNGRTHFPLDGRLTWNATATDESSLTYQLYFGESVDTLKNQVNLSAKYYLPQNNWDEEKEYFWKVRAFQGNRYSDSEIWHFTTGRGDDFEIRLDSPASGTADVDIYTPMTWQATENLISSATPVYYVYIADTIEQLSYVHPYETRELSFMIPSGRWEYNEVYYWKVEGYDGTQRAFGGPSVFTTRSEEIISPTVDLLQPSENEQNVDPDISFSWKGHSSYIRAPLVYEVYIALQEAELYTTPPATILTEQEQYIPPDPLNIATAYFWRIKVIQGTLTGESTGTFTTRGPIYEIPEIVLLTPENGATGVDLNTVLTWEASGSTSREIDDRAESIEYRVYVADNLASMSSHDYIVEATTTEKRYTPATDWAVERSYVWTADIYYYVDDVLVASNTANPHSFTTRGLLPAVPSDAGLIPADDTTNVSIYTQLDWGINVTAETATPSYYEIYMDTSGNPTTLIATSLFTSFQPSRLSTGTDYYWKVISVNPLGTAEGPEWHFKTRDDTLSRTTDVAVKGEHVYAAEQENGFSVYWIPSSPATPLELKAHVSLESLVNGVDVNGNSLFVSIGNSGVVIYDISDPEHPVYVSSVDDNGYCIASDTLGDTLYLANGFNGSSVDISDIHNPDSIGKIETSEEASGSAIDLVADTVGLFTRVYIADGVNGLTITDVTVPATPLTFATGVLNLAADVESVGIDKQDDYVYVVSLTRSEDEFDMDDSGNGLTIVQSTMLQNQVISQVNTPGFSKDVFVNGNYAYIADGTNGLEIVDCTDPSSPDRIVRNVSVEIQANAVYVVGTTAFVAAEEDGVVCIDCSDPENQKRIHH